MAAVDKTDLVWRFFTPVDTDDEDLPGTGSGTAKGKSSRETAEKNEETESTANRSDEEMPKESMPDSSEVDSSDEVDFKAKKIVVPKRSMQLRAKKMLGNEDDSIAGTPNDKNNYEKSPSSKEAEK